MFFLLTMIHKKFLKENHKPILELQCSVIKYTKLP